jgi:hypothetical protein
VNSFTSLVDDNILRGGVRDLFPDIIAGFHPDALVALLLRVLEQRGALGKLGIVLVMPPVIDGEADHDSRHDRAADPIGQHKREDPDEAGDDSAQQIGEVHRPQHDQGDGPDNAERADCPPGSLPP